MIGAVVPMSIIVIAVSAIAWDHVTETLLIQNNNSMSGIYKATSTITCKTSTVQDGDSAVMRAPVITFETGFHAESGSHLDAKIIEVFKVHLAVMFDHDGGQDEGDPVDFISENDLYKEVDVLNQFFVASDGIPPVLFKYESGTTWNEIDTEELESDPCVVEAATLYDGDPGVGPEFGIAFNCVEPDTDCDGCDSMIVDDSAINVYIYNSDYPGGKNFSYGTRNASGRAPYVLIDYHRDDHKGDPAEEHEMGHAFGLGHTCTEAGIDTDPEDTDDPETNIMHQQPFCKDTAHDSYCEFDTDTSDGCNENFGNGIDPDEYVTGTRSIGFYYLPFHDCAGSVKKVTQGANECETPPDKGQFEIILENAAEIKNQLD